MGRLSVAVNAVGLAPGGGLTYLVNQARVFEQMRELELTYFVAPRSVEALSTVVPSDRVVVPFPRSPGYMRRFLWEQLRLPDVIKTRGFDILYAPASFAVFRSSVPQVLVDHNPWHFASRKELGSLFTVLRARVQRSLAKASARRAEAVVYLSAAFSERMIAVGFPAPSDIIPSGVSVDWESADDDHVYNVACATCDRGFALAVHNWYPHKRLAWLAWAWCKLYDPSQRHLVIVGAPFGRAFRRWQRAVAKRRSNESVHIVENLSRPAVASLYRRASIFLSASVLEAFPLTPFEAMAFGVPCVLSDISAHREVAGSAATYFGVGNLLSLATAVRRSDADRSAVIAAGHVRVASFSWAHNARQFLEVFQRVATAPDCR